MRVSDYEDTIAEIQAAYERGEYSDDPEMRGLRASREQQEALERRKSPRKASKASLSEAVFISPSKPILEGPRTLEDVELELAAGRYGYRAEPWTGPTGPMAVPEVADSPQRFRALIEAWERDPTGYLAELRRRGLVR